MAWLVSYLQEDIMYKQSSMIKGKFLYEHNIRDGLKLIIVAKFLLKDSRPSLIPRTYHNFEIDMAKDGFESSIQQLNQ